MTLTKSRLINADGDNTNGAMNMKLQLRAAGQKGVA
jgi:hypothetical protein